MTEDQEPVSENLAKLKQLEPLIMNAELGLSFFDQSPDAAVIVDDNANIVLVNGKAELLFGYHRTELIGKSVDILLPDDVQARHQAHRVGFFVDPRPRQMGVGIAGLRGRKKNGQDVPVEINLSPVMTTKGFFTIATVRRRA